MLFSSSSYIINDLFAHEFWLRREKFSQKTRDNVAFLRRIRFAITIEHDEWSHTSSKHTSNPKILEISQLCEWCAKT